MTKKFSIVVIITAVILLCEAPQAQQSDKLLWKDETHKKPPIKGNLVLMPQEFRLVKLEEDAVWALLLQANEQPYGATLSYQLPTVYSRLSY